MFLRHWVKEFCSALSAVNERQLKGSPDFCILSYCGIGVPMDIVRLPSYDESVQMEWFSQHGMGSDSYRILIRSEVTSGESNR